MYAVGVNASQENEEESGCSLKKLIRNARSENYAKH